MDTAYRLLAARYIDRQARQLRRQLSGARRSDDIEFVHRARVAARRLRTALKFFADCFTATKLRQWRKSIRRVGRALGDARDRDVQIEYLYELLCRVKTKEHLPGVIGVLVAMLHQRRRRQRRVVEGIERFYREGTLAGIRQATGKLAPPQASDDQAMPKPARKTMQRAGRHIRRRLKKMLRHEDSLHEYDQSNRQHAMRIAVKHLRYAMEICRPLYAGRLDPMIEAVKQAQTMLGELHDCDVWRDELRAIKAGKAGRLAPTLGGAVRRRLWIPGVELLREDREKHRRRTFDELAAYWAKLRRRDLWNKLRAIVG
jgi:CHAD domain-containing protein